MRLVSRRPGQLTLKSPCGQAIGKEKRLGSRLQGVSVTKVRETEIRTIKARSEHATSHTHANEPQVTAEGIANAKKLENMPRKEAFWAWKRSCTLASDLSSSVGVGDAARFAPTAGSDGAATSSTGSDVTSKVVPSLAAAACPGSSIVAAATVQFARSVTNGARRSEHGVRGANGTRKHCRKKPPTDISQNRTPNPDPPQQATQHGSPHQA